jgi:hypothetical protein
MKAGVNDAYGIATSKKCKSRDFIKGKGTIYCRIFCSASPLLSPSKEKFRIFIKQKKNTTDSNFGLSDSKLRIPLFIKNVVCS